MIEIKPEDQPYHLSNHQIFRDGKRIGWILEKYRERGTPIGFLSLNDGVTLTEQDKQELCKLLSGMFHVLYQVSPDDDLYKRMQAEWIRRTDT